MPVHPVLSSATFDVSELAVGVYFLHAAGAAGQTLKTFTILIID
jgi:hypothetical protein